MIPRVVHDSQKALFEWVLHNLKACQENNHVKNSVRYESEG